ncbi:Peptidyl-tRNA hydrolase [Spathaspora sp. JA1]|nr:Peptidyl-tRNA hydrolase [Spathaspora sp. JA1]
MILPRNYPQTFVRRINTNTTTNGLFIASIGNPEPQYANTRHNVGHRMMNQLINIYWKSHITSIQSNLYQSSKYPNILLFKSNDQYMNLQGKPVSSQFNKIRKQYSQLVILHDELQLDLGKYQIRKPGTSARGHNGLKSINSYLKNDYLKFGIGIGRPNSKQQVVDHVLSKFNLQEQEIIDYDVIPKCVEDLEKLIQDNLNKNLQDANK